MVCKLTTVKFTGSVADLGEGLRGLGPSHILGEQKIAKRRKADKARDKKTGFPFTQGLDPPLRLINTQEDLTSFQSDTCR